MSRLQSTVLDFDDFHQCTRGKCRYWDLITDVGVVGSFCQKSRQCACYLVFDSGSVNYVRVVLHTMETSTSRVYQ